jgi:hypothetical protein
MSAVTIAHLDELRANVMWKARATAEHDKYADALQKAPRAVVVAHLLRATLDLLVLAGQRATRRARP